MEIGRNREESYANGEGDRVVWRFAEVVTVDELRADDLDGAEVQCPVEGVRQATSRSTQCSDPTIPSRE